MKHDQFFHLLFSDIMNELDKNDNYDKL